MVIGLKHLSSSHGLLKVLHLVFGGVSLILVWTAYVHYWALDLFLAAVSICFILSLMLLLLHVTLQESFTNAKYVKICSCMYHFLAGLLLIIVGIDLIGWSDYDASCGYECPYLYTIGVAKILTFINGTLYGIHGFMEAKVAEDDEDFYDESLPLIRIKIDPPTPTSSTHSLSSYNQYYQPPTAVEATAHFSGQQQRDYSSYIN